MTFLAVPLVYDSVLTVADEIAFIRHHKLSVASVLFMVNRVAAIILVLYLPVHDVDSVGSSLIPSSPADP